MSDVKYELGKPVTEIIKARTSVRTYESKPISEELRGKISAWMKNLRGPFNVPVQLELVDSNILKQQSDVKLGTYGVIKGASSFIIATVEKTDRHAEELGYIFEKAVLYATSLGLGTCWLGGTFKKEEFAKAVRLKENEIMPIVSPIGYGRENRSILESIMRFAAGSKNRKPWEELFFSEDFNGRLLKEQEGKYGEALEMVRLAPSASNKQPWRVVKKSNHYHFFLQRTKGYAKAMGFDIQKLDVGIAMCHFEMAAREAGLAGSWQAVNTGIGNPPEDSEYVISWVQG